MSNAALNSYFERAVQDFAVEHLKDCIEQAATKEAAENEEYLAREVTWYEKQNDIERTDDTLLIKVGEAVWKIPVKDADFVKNILPVFAKPIPDLELAEAAELRKLQNQLRRNRQRLNPERRTALEKQIEDAKATLIRARGRTPVPRYGIFKTIDGRDVGVHRLYLPCREDEQAAAFDGDLTNFCNVALRYEVKRNFGLTAHQEKTLAPIYQDRTVRNLYIVSSSDNPSHERRQNEFERDGIVLTIDAPDYVEGRPTPLQPNKSVLGTDDQHAPPLPARVRRAIKALDQLFED